MLLSALLSLLGGDTAAVAPPSSLAFIPCGSLRSGGAAACCRPVSATLDTVSKRKRVGVADMQDRNGKAAKGTVGRGGACLMAAVSGDKEEEKMELAAEVR